MSQLVIGLHLFLGVHSLGYLAPAWRAQQRARLGEGAWKGLYALASVAGFALLVWGFSLARPESAVLWVAPAGMRHGTALLMVLAFILLVAAYVPGTHLRQALGHPMLVATKLWALGHLLANGRVVDVVLFGAFLAWAIFGYAISRRRDRASGTRYPARGWSRDALAVVIGVLAWGAFAHVGHQWLIGVSPLG